MKKIYVTPEMEEFKYEIPTLYGAEEASGAAGKTLEEGGGDSL
jgi:hypothetical protein